MTLRVDFRAAVGAHLVTEEVGISHEIKDGAFRAQIRLGRLLTPRRKYLHMVTPANQIVGAPSGWVWVVWSLPSHRGGILELLSFIIQVV